MRAITNSAKSIANIAFRNCFITGLATTAQVEFLFRARDFLVRLILERFLLLEALFSIILDDWDSYTHNNSCNECKCNNVLPIELLPLSLPWFPLSQNILSVDCNPPTFLVTVLFLIEQVLHNGFIRNLTDAEIWRAIRYPFVR